jgi:very-short-patch-repair endonuclease
VLRFTNEEIADDMSRVLGIIEQVLMTRRGGRTNP